MAELGETNDPTALIPGNPNTIPGTVSALRTYGDLLSLAGEGLQRIDTTSGWSGPSADAFRKVFDGQPSKWIQAGQAFHNAATALDNYAPTLASAQQQASVAIGQWNSGEANHPRAQDTLSRARTQLASAGDAAATAVGKARDLAPPKPGFWSRLGDDIGSIASNIGHGLETATSDFVNSVASVGNAMVNDPGDTVKMIGGLALAGVSGLGDGVGGVLDATGIGAIVGVPLNVISTAGVVTGVGLASAGALGIARNAAGPDQVNVMNSDSGGGSGWNSEPHYQTVPVRSPTKRATAADRSTTLFTRSRTSPVGADWAETGIRTSLSTPPPVRSTRSALMAVPPTTASVTSTTTYPRGTSSTDGYRNARAGRPVDPAAAGKPRRCGGPGR